MYRWCVYAPTGIIYRNGCGGIFILDLSCLICEQIGCLGFCLKQGVVQALWGGSPMVEGQKRRPCVCCFQVFFPPLWQLQWTWLGDDVCLPGSVHPRKRHMSDDTLCSVSAHILQFWSRRSGCVKSLCTKEQFQHTKRFFILISFLPLYITFYDKKESVLS